MNASGAHAGYWYHNCVHVCMNARIFDAVCVCFCITCSVHERAYASVHDVDGVVYRPSVRVNQDCNPIDAENHQRRAGLSEAGLADVPHEPQAHGTGGADW